MSATKELQPKQTTTAKLPYLWVSDYFAASPLANCFEQIYSPDTPPAKLNSSEHHILALDPDTPEKIWKEIAYTLQGAGCEVSIKEIGKFGKQPLEWWLKETPANHVAIEIISQYMPYSDWEKSLAEESLLLDEALELAELVLRHLGEGKKANIALERLRRRAEVSEYKWEKEFLADIRAELEKSLALNSSGNTSDDPDERLRLDLLALAKETDPIKRVRRLGELACQYRIKIAQLEKLSKLLLTQTKAPDAKWMGIDELFDSDIPGLEYLIPGMLPKGDSVLLLADPKVGKSLLAYDAAFAVATGESDFLGEKTQRGKVLIVQADEPQHSTKFRLLKRGFRPEDAANVEYISQFNISQMQKLEEKLEIFRPSLVIIDSLRKINVGREISENSAEFADLIYELKELLTKYGASGIIIHHANKNPDATGIHRCRGSSSIPATVWGIWDFQRILKSRIENGRKVPYYDPKDLNRTLTITPRDGAGMRLKLELDLENNHWLSHGEEGISEDEKQERKSQNEQVLEILQKVAPTGLEAQEINESLGLGRGIYSILNRLLERGLIGTRPSNTDKRRTVYYCPSSGEGKDVKKSNCHKEEPPLPPVCVPSVIESAESNSGYSVQRSITNRSQVDHRLITTSEKNEDVIDFSPEVASTSEVDHNSGAQRGGVGGTHQLSHSPDIQKVVEAFQAISERYDMESVVFFNGSESETYEYTDDEAKEARRVEARNKDFPQAVQQNESVEESQEIQTETPLDMAVNQPTDSDESNSTASYYEEEPIDESEKNSESEKKIQEVVKVLQGLFDANAVENWGVVHRMLDSHDCTNYEAEEIMWRLDKELERLEIDAEPTVEDAIADQPDTPLGNLIRQLASVESEKEFDEALEGVNCDLIEDAINMQAAPQKRQQLRGYLESGGYMW